MQATRALAGSGRQVGGPRSMDGGLVIAASRTEQRVRRPHAVRRRLGRSAIAGLAVSMAIALASEIVAAPSAFATDSVPPRPEGTVSGPPSPGGPVSGPPSPGGPVSVPPRPG